MASNADIPQNARTLICSRLCVHRQTRLTASFTIYTAQCYLQIASYKTRRPFTKFK